MWFKLPPNTAVWYLVSVYLRRQLSVISEELRGKSRLSICWHDVHILILPSLTRLIALPTATVIQGFSFSFVKALSLLQPSLLHLQSLTHLTEGLLAACFCLWSSPGSACCPVRRGQYHLQRAGCEWSPSWARAAPALVHSSLLWKQKKEHVNIDNVIIP